MCADTKEVPVVVHVAVDITMDEFFIELDGAGSIQVVLRSKDSDELEEAHQACTQLKHSHYVHATLRIPVGTPSAKLDALTDGSDNTPWITMMLDQFKEKIPVWLNGAYPDPDPLPYTPRPLGR